MAYYRTCYVIITEIKPIRMRGMSYYPLIQIKQAL